MMHTPFMLADDVHGVETDVLIVGYGPVGQVLSILLAQRGWNVTVVERWPEPYTMPRAVAFDSEAARVLAAAGVGDFMTEFGECSGEYTWRTADGKILLHSEISEHGWCHWPDSTSMYQPGLEATLAAHGAKFPNLRVFRGYRAVELIDCDNHVVLLADGHTGSRLSIRAHWVVGCDGANSFVRERINTQVTDLGFAHDWLICDVVLAEPHEFRPNNLQICDPARPRTSVSAGPGHRRWEFMRVPDEPIEELNTAEAAWRLLELFDITPRNAELDRFAVYTFQSCYTDQWHAGRKLLAGDSAHLMPPFAGQGMSSGFRDAMNLAWKLDLVLADRADEGLLDTYTAERRDHVQHAVRMSLNLGKVICQVDPKAAADIHDVLLAARKHGHGTTTPRSGIHPLAGGFLHNPEGGVPRSPVGELTPQARVAVAGKVGMFDDAIGRGWVFLASEDPHRLLDPDCLAFLAGIGAQLVHLVAADTPPTRATGNCAVDIDDVYLPYLAGSETISILVRPDFYVFGAARDEHGSVALVTHLREAISTAVLTC